MVDQVSQYVFCFFSHTLAHWKVEYLKLLEDKMCAKEKIAMLWMFQ